METIEHLLYQLHLSYLHARKNKRNTHNQLRFEMYQEEGLMCRRIVETTFFMAKIYCRSSC